MASKQLSFSAGEAVEVLLPLPFARGFDYAVPDGMNLAPGDYVTVPFGSKQANGVVWGKALGDVAKAKIKPIGRVHAFPPMKEETREFIAWASWYTMAPLGLVLKMALAAPKAFLPEKHILHFHCSGKTPLPLTDARKRVLSLMKDGIARPLANIAKEADVSSGVVKGLVDDEVLVLASAPEKPTPPPLTIPEGPVLSDSQRSAAEIMKARARDGFSVTLLDGVTGSGKTEVYFDAIAEALKEDGAQVLVLLPEIALTAQFLSRFTERFGHEPSLWHSAVTETKRIKTWRKVTSGEARVVVGARSALFLPYRNLRLIVVDEEHDSSYKQEEGVIYQARDMAVARAHAEKFAVALVSATPSLETIQNVEQKKYERVHLPARHFEATLPDVTLIDMRREKMPASEFLSSELREALVKNYAEGHQAMLFLNRRGYAPLLLCRSCGYRFQCPECSSWLVLHKQGAKLCCHHCGYNLQIPKLCPECGAEESLHACGPGVERVTEEVKEFLPGAKLAQMTSDVITTMDDAGAVVRDMEAGKIDILIGTQMMAKGHHFPKLALVGVVDGDLGLAGGDLRAGERTYQMLHQISGRAGREMAEGKVLIQTFSPEHPVMQALASEGRDAFMNVEAEYRRAAEMPPFSRLVALVVEGVKEHDVIAYAKVLAKTAPNEKAVVVWGPAPAPLARLKGKHRWRILLKADRHIIPQHYLNRWLILCPPPRTIRLKIDVDPYSFV